MLKTVYLTPHLVTPLGPQITLRQLRGLVDDLCRLVPEAEQDSIEITGHVDRIGYAHTLTPAEQVVDLQAQLERAEAVIRELRQRIDPQTGSDTPGTPAAPIGHTWGPTEVREATPEDRRQVFLNWWVQSGWRPDNLTPVWFGLKQQGVTVDEAEEWLIAAGVAIERGALEANARERGLS